MRAGFWISILSSLWINQTVLAYIPTVTSAGTPIRWKQPIKLNFYGNPNGKSGVTDTEFYHAAILGLQRWNEASSNLILFDYWQGRNKKDFPTTGAYDGQSTLYFLSNSDAPSTLTGNILGMTQVWYNTESGEILETDIVLNDQDFYFTNNPTDTSGYGANTSNFTGNRNNVYIQNVITHELGHAVGLSHSGGLQSTMLFMESPEQAHLGCDDRIGIHAIYPTSDATSRGGLVGKVLSEMNTPLFGVHIEAISEARGTVLASTITDKTGQYSFSSLEPGRYYLMAEPYYAGPQALPQYYSSVNSTICSGSAFPRGFLVEADHTNLVPILVTVAAQSKAPDLVIHCKSSIGIAPHNSAATRTIRDPNHFAIVDLITPNEPRLYRLENLSGYFEVHAVGYSLYSPIHSSLELLDADGNLYPTTIQDPVYRGDSGFIDYDDFLIVDNLPRGTFFLRVSGNQLQPNDYPAGPISLDSVPFLTLIGATYPSGISASISANMPLISVLPNNARCHTQEYFEKYESPSQIAPPTPRGSSESKPVGFCGTTASLSRKGSEVPYHAILGWFIPWLLMLGGARTFTLLHRTHPKAKIRG